MALNPAMADLLLHRHPPPGHNPTKFIVQDITHNALPRPHSTGVSAVAPHQDAGMSIDEEAPRVAEISKAPEVPKIPLVPVPPEIPETPKISKASDAPTAPKSPVTAEAPKIHEIPKSPETAKPAEVPVAPGPFRLCRQSSSLLLDATDMDKVVKQKDEVVVESVDGHLYSIQTDETQCNGLCEANLFQSTHHLTRHSSASSHSSSSSKLNTVLSYQAHEGYKNAPQNLIEIVAPHTHTLFRKEACFTHYQAMEYLMQKSPLFLESSPTEIVASRGEGSNLLSLLMKCGILQYCNPYLL